MLSLETPFPLKAYRRWRVDEVIRYDWQEQVTLFESWRSGVRELEAGPEETHGPGV